MTVQNEELTMFSGTAAATFNTGTVTQDGVAVARGHRNNDHRGARFHLNISAITGTLDVKIQAFAAGVWHDIAGAVFAQKSATGQDELVVYPGVTVAANVSVSDIIPRDFRAVCTIGTGPCTFVLAASLVV